MKTITKKIKVYNFNELSQDAKERALSDYIQNGMDYEWYDFIVDDAKEIGNIIGIDIDNVYFSGFYSQGDGACFTGKYQYKKDYVKKLKEYAPKDGELHRIAEELFKIQKKNFYQVMAWVNHRGHYYHEMCTDISVERNDYAQFDDGEDIKELLRDFMRWIYKSLEKEYDYLTSEECFAENCEANEYTFLENGKMANY